MATDTDPEEHAMTTTESPIDPTPTWGEVYEGWDPDLDGQGNEGLAAALDRITAERAASIVTGHLSAKGLRRAADLLESRPAPALPTTVPTISELAEGGTFLVADAEVLDTLAAIGERARPAMRRAR